MWWARRVRPVLYYPYSEFPLSPRVNCTWRPDSGSTEWYRGEGGLWILPRWLARAKLFALEDSEENAYAAAIPKNVEGLDAQYLYELCWALGVPTVIVENKEEAIYVLQHVSTEEHRWVELLPPGEAMLFLRGRCKRFFRGATIPWWEWSSSFVAECPHGHSAPPVQECSCGFYGTFFPHFALHYSSYELCDVRALLICAPAKGARVVVHEHGLRCSSYEVLAAITSLNSGAPPHYDSRRVPALNVLAKALEVYGELQLWHQIH